MTIDWEVYDLKRQFSLRMAANLWVKQIPTKDRWVHLFEDHGSDMVFTELVEYFEIFFADQEKYLKNNPECEDNLSLAGEIRAYRNFNMVTRTRLMEFSIVTNQRPQFLYPEERESYIPIGSNKPQHALPDEKIDPRKEKSLLGLIKILAIASNNLPDDSDTAGKLARIAQSNSIKLGEDTIRKHLKAAFEIDKNDAELG